MTSSTSELAVAAASNRPARALRVLIVDDHPDVAQVLQSLIRHAGHEPRLAATGPEAIAAVQEFQPDVAFVDIGLPGMTGYELAAQLRGDLLAAAPALVALTGRDASEDRRLSTEAGFAFHLVKPPNWTDLAQVLQHFVNQRQPALWSDNTLA
jgi:CheY-like chemotaxis protein